MSDTLIENAQNAAATPATNAPVTSGTPATSAPPPATSGWLSSIPEDMRAMPVFSGIKAKDAAEALPILAKMLRDNPGDPTLGKAKLHVLSSQSGRTPTTRTLTPSAPPIRPELAAENAVKVKAAADVETARQTKLTPEA